MSQKLTFAPPGRAADSLAWLNAFDVKTKHELLMRLLAEARWSDVTTSLLGHKFLADSLRLPGMMHDDSMEAFLQRLSNAPEPAPSLDVYHFADLESYRSDVASVARFSQRIDFATVHLCAAFGTSDFEFVWKSAAPQHPRRNRQRNWYAHFVDLAFSRYDELRLALVCKWTPSIEAEPFAKIAFRSLCDLTPAQTQLSELFQHDRRRAFDELARHLDAVVDQLKLATSLAENLADGEQAKEAAQDEKQLDSVQSRLLAEAGEALSLTQAAKRLNMTRQNLHKRIKAGSALGVMRGSEIVVPSIQFVEGEKGLQIVDHLRDVLLPFAESGAGNWSALQFLIEQDPNLEDSPLTLLRGGKAAQAVAAARTFLGLDDD